MNRKDHPPVKSVRVALVTMPFFPFTHPSIQIGLLRSHAERAGFRVDSFHLNLDFAALMPVKFYDQLSNHRGRMTSEWFFTEAAFGDSKPSVDDYFHAFPEEAQFLRKSRVSLSYIKKLRNEIIPAFLERCMRSVRWGKYNLIGFSSIFQQNVASLALARRIKEAHPHSKIIFGGANMEGEMGIEYLRAFPFLDFVALGEGDKLFPDLLQSLEEGRNPDNISGLAYRLNGSVFVNSLASPIQDMDSLPVPNYDEYFKRSKKLNLQISSMQFFMPLETARGCWWGEKHHCTFCGLNGSNMKFRSKSADSVIREMTTVSSMYGCTFFSITDNILDVHYMKELFSKTEKLPRNYRFSWEVKSNLNREQIRLLFLGGMRALQPGIESLNTHVLQLMRKGCNMLQNVATLKWCRYYEMQAYWNLLYGFPGELEGDYVKQLQVVKLISHLQPPHACTRIWLERFAPIYFDRNSFPAKFIKPDSSYAYAYPVGVDLEKIAYFFEYELEDTVPDDVLTETKEWIQKWKQTWEKGPSDFFTYSTKKGRLLLNDRRKLLRTESCLPGKYEFPAPAGWIYDFCGDTYRTVRQTTEELARQGHQTDENTIQGILESLTRSGYMLVEEGKYLSLAFPESTHSGISRVQ